MLCGLNQYSLALSVYIESCSSHSKVTLPVWILETAVFEQRRSRENLFPDILALLESGSRAEPLTKALLMANTNTTVTDIIE